MGRGKFKGKPTGRRHFSTLEELSQYSPLSLPLLFKCILCPFIMFLFIYLFINAF